MEWPYISCNISALQMCITIWPWPKLQLDQLAYPKA